ncbi:hypothetical protein C2S52_017276 [Perilla frutescens var. hirtella]|nr:hypothetical protein C2S52_017276 [Perilla frutescens var. hirtella]
MISILLLLLQWQWRCCQCQKYSYDPTPCSSGSTRYTCTSTATSCRTFFAYRANHRFSTISAISSLFQTDPDTLLSINTNVSASSQVLESGHEVLVPITCSCSADNFYQSLFNYTATHNSTLSEIACNIFEGLVKSVTLEEENRVPGNSNAVRAGSVLRVPLKCACLDDFKDDGLKYLITYPLIERDSTTKVGKKFNVSVEEIWKFNSLNPFAPTVFPTTTVLVPVRDEPFINFSIPNSDPPAPQFLPTRPFERRPKISQVKKLYIVGSVVGFCLILALLMSCGLYMKALKKCEDQRLIQSSTMRRFSSCSTPTRSSTNSCLSPDLLVGIKYSLGNYSVEELRMATKSFSEEAKMSSSMYKGVMKNGEEVMMIEMKQMRLEGSRQLIDVHSRMNHVNIVKLKGVCYGEEKSSSYLVFEFPSNGSLRDCLSISCGALNWHRRTQIAFDVATGLHYLHYSVSPAYTTQLSLNSRRVFLNTAWRAKIAVYGTRCLSGSDSEACLVNAEKVEIFAFGEVLLELISGKEGVERESMTFLGGTGTPEGGCFDQLRNFVDPSLKDDYPLAEALCLAVLAGSCVQHDPMHRPSMEDVLKILATIL